MRALTFQGVREVAVTDAPDPRVEEPGDAVVRGSEDPPELVAALEALDRALVKFHATKMRDINRVVTELWNKTYKGSDIDALEIKSEHEGETESGRRKQSYRVVMRKGDTCLDMRGRCSAGQKVAKSGRLPCEGACSAWQKLLPALVF